VNTVDRYVAVFEHDGDNERTRVGPFVFESYLNESTLEAAIARTTCAAAKTCGRSRIARLDFDLANSWPDDMHVVVVEHDGVYRSRGPLVWETVLQNAGLIRQQAHAERISKRAGMVNDYGNAHVARIVFVDLDAIDALRQWRAAEATNDELELANARRARDLALNPQPGQQATTEEPTA
jgi:hypothetical protein